MNKNNTDEYILQKGYSEIPVSLYDSVNVEKCFQKKIKDKKGIKYLILIRKWKSVQHPYTKEWSDPVYEYSVQLYGIKNHDAINLIFHTSWTIDTVEDHLEKMFLSGLYDYYEYD